MCDLKERLNLERVDFSHEIFARDKRGEGINYQSEGWDEMKKAITNAQKLVAHLNSGFHSGLNTRKFADEVFLEAMLETRAFCKFKAYLLFLLCEFLQRLKVINNFHTFFYFLIDI